MTLKWIVCRTPPGSRAAFDTAQREWSELTTVPGFRGQCGGFVGHDAQILGLWKDDAACESFMRTTHDRIVGHNAQSRHYTAIDVELLELGFDMPGVHPEIPRALAEARFLRLADCRVKPGHTERFMTVQHEVWRSGMANVPGMLAGAVWSFRETSDRYLVTTLWSDETAHARYVAGPLTALRASARPPEDLTSLDGYTFALNLAWTVGPGRS